MKNNKNILTFDHCGDIVSTRTRGKIAQRGKCERVAGKEDVMKKEKKDIVQRKQVLTKWTKYLLDIMFYGGIIVTASLPFSLKLIIDYLPWIGNHYAEHYEETVIIYFVLGVSAVVLLRELRKIFKTVLDENCFVMENVTSLRKMGNWSFFIAGMCVVRSIVWMTIAMMVVIFVFIIAGLFSKVLALVFEEAVRYKEENDLTI